MFQHMLVPLDGSSLSESALPYAVAVARAFNAPVTLLHVLEQPATAHLSQTVDPLDWQIQKTEADLYLSRIRADLEKLGLQTESAVLEGRVADRIVEYAQTNDVDLIILSSHGQTGSGNWNIGSVTQKILQKTPTSTLLTRARNTNQAAVDEPGQFRFLRLLVPLDGSRRAEYPLLIATTLAQANEAQVLLLHIVSRPEMARRTPLTHEDVDLINRILERNQEEGRRYLEDLQSHLPANVQTRLLVSDNVATSLHDLIEQEDIDLLVLSAHGYSGTPRWLYGSITSRFITEGNVPLLIVQDLPSSTPEPPQSDVATRRPGY
jgi:nucleotide-binding universal stress UspA family protein